MSVGAAVVVSATDEAAVVVAIRPVSPAIGVGRPDAVVCDIAWVVVVRSIRPCVVSEESEPAQETRPSANTTMAMVVFLIMDCLQVDARSLVR